EPACFKNCLRSQTFVRRLFTTVTLTIEWRAMVNTQIRNVAIVGTGLIGASWAAQYLASGFDVVASDPAPNAESKLREYVDAAWPALTAIGLSPAAKRARVKFASRMKEALSGADFVQENGPERPDFKIKLFAEMDEA